MRDELFREHPESPVPVHLRASFPGAPYFDYDPDARVLADIRSIGPETLAIGTSRQDPIRFTRFGVASFELYERLLSLELHWLAPPQNRLPVSVRAGERIA